MPGYKKPISVSNSDSALKANPKPEPIKKRETFIFQTAKDASISASNDNVRSLNSVSKCVIHTDGKHVLSDCNVFRKLSFPEKRKHCFENGLCYLCLGKHKQSDCQNPPSCSKCKRKHLTVMHNDSIPSSSETNKSSNLNDKSSLCTKFCSNKEQFRSCSKIVLTELTHNSHPGKTLKCYTIIDEQSTSCFATSRVSEIFNVNGPVIEYSLNTLSGSQSNLSGIELNGFHIKGVGEKRGFALPPMVVNDCIINNKREIATPEIVKHHSHVAHLSKYFQPIDESAEIVLLLGRDCGKALQTSCFGHKAPFAHHTRLGWALVGETCLPDYSFVKSVYKVDFSHDHFVKKQCFPVSSCPKALSSFNIFEETPLDEQPALSMEDKRFVQIVHDGIKISEKGFITLPLPFKNEDVKMPDNRLAVYGRTHNSLKRLKTNPEKLNLTLDVMQKYISAGHVEEIPTSQSTPPPRKSWYIPIFPVSHPKKKKVRIVFDSSACYNGTSLNQQLLQGPDVNNLLRTVLFTFRLSPVGFCADVETMFHNFELQLEHRDFTRFFWFSENNPENSIAQFRATRHVFGNTSSPSLANIGLRFAISNASPRPPPEAEDFVFNNFYVDDGLASCDSPEQAIKILKHTKATLQQFNIRLCKICSNDISVMAAFPPTECNISPYLIPLNNDLLQSTLGISWNTSRDELIVQKSVPDRPFTKRGVRRPLTVFSTLLALLVPLFSQAD